MARAIIRYSLDGDYGQGNGVALRNLLLAGGFDNIGTASWEYDDGNPDPTALLEAIRTVMDRLDELSPGVSLDHLWIYVDRPNRPDSN